MPDQGDNLEITDDFMNPLSTQLAIDNVMVCTTGHRATPGRHERGSGMSCAGSHIGRSCAGSHIGWSGRPRSLRASPREVRLPEVWEDPSDGFYVLLSDPGDLHQLVVGRSLDSGDAPQRAKERLLLRRPDAGNVVEGGVKAP